MDADTPRFSSSMEEHHLRGGLLGRLVVATRLAALPGEVVPLVRDDLLRMAPKHEDVAPHSPLHGIRRRCPDTGATLVETMLLAPLGPNPGRIAYDVHDAPDMRPFRIATILDIGHHGRDAMPGDMDPARWPGRSSAHARLAAALDGTIDLVAHIERGLPQPGLKAREDALELVQRLARMRVLVARTHAPDKVERISDEKVAATLPSPWTRASMHASEWFAATRPDRGNPILTPAATSAFLDRMPLVGRIADEVVIDEEGNRTDHYDFVDQSVLAGPPDEPQDDVVAAMRDVMTLGLAHSDFVF